MVLSSLKPTNIPTKESVFPVAWYAIASSHSVSSKPLGIRRLGIDLVLWRDANGKIVCQSRHCPHRGVDLALGKISTSTQNGKSCLECPYHGFQFAADGHCILMPCEGKEARISPAMKLNSYKVRESHGFIWLWWGETELATANIPWFAELRDDPCRWADGELVWDVHFTRAVESALIDVHHFAFAHRRIAKWSGIGQVIDSLETQVVGNQIKTQGVIKNQQKGGFSVRFKNEIVFPNLSVFDFGLGGIKLFVTLTPINQNHTWISFRYYVPFGWSFLSRLIAKIAVWFELNFVQPDDYRLIKSTVPKHSGLKENRFVHADQTIVHWHRLNKHHQSTK